MGCISGPLILGHSHIFAVALTSPKQLQPWHQAAQLTSPKLSKADIPLEKQACVYMYICVYVYTYIYTYIHNIYTYIYTYTHDMYIHIYA